MTRSSDHLNLQSSMVMKYFQKDEERSQSSEQKALRKATIRLQKMLRNATEECFEQDYRHSSVQRQSVGRGEWKLSSSQTGTARLKFANNTHRKSAAFEGVIFRQVQI